MFTRLENPLDRIVELSKSCFEHGGEGNRLSGKVIHLQFI